MPKKTRKLGHDGQLHLPTMRAGLCGRRNAVKEALKRLLYDIDRESLAAEISRLLGETIHKSVIDSYIAESKEKHRFPLEFSAALAEATGSVDHLAAALPDGYRIIGPDEEPFLELGKIAAAEEEAKDLRRRKQDLLRRVVR